MTIYKNGQFKVVPLIAGFRIVGPKGDTGLKYSPEGIHDAVEDCDVMAREDGVVTEGVAA